MGRSKQRLCMRCEKRQRRLGSWYCKECILILADLKRLG